MPQAETQEAQKTLCFHVFLDEWQKLCNSEISLSQLTDVPNPAAVNHPIRLIEIIIQPKEERDKERTNSIVGAMLCCR